MPFPDLTEIVAHRVDVNDVMIDELTSAGIDIVDSKIRFRGELHGWVFIRENNYWAATGPGIPPDAADALHVKYGASLRVENRENSPNPLDRYHGLACGDYGIHEPDSLKALARTIKDIVNTNNVERAKVKPVSVTYIPPFDGLGEKEAFRAALLKFFTNLTSADIDHLDINHVTISIPIIMLLETKKLLHDWMTVIAPHPSLLASVNQSLSDYAVNIINSDKHLIQLFPISTEFNVSFQKKYRVLFTFRCEWID